MSFRFEAAKPKVAVKAVPTKVQPVNSRLEAENKQLKDKLAKLESEHAELIKVSQRRSKDLANYKDRVDRERRETFRNQLANLAIQMLPALDNLNRAVDSAIELQQTEKNEFHHFFDGVALVNQQVNEVLAEMGITSIPTVGEFFDPHFHEAAAIEESDEFEPNTISAEILKGYRIGDRVIRHSIVRVAKAKAEPGETPVLEKMISQESDDSEQPASEDPSGSTNDEADQPTEEASE
jgi:molecular chaperone GrpE